MCNFQLKEIPDACEEALCGGCGCETRESDFDSIDDEFNPSQPMCPPCQASQRMRNQPCEHCDEPAEYETDSGFLCCEHHSQYVDGYISRD